MASVIDADTHIVESQSIWDLMEEEMYHRRPVLVSVPDDTLYGNLNAFWLIDGNILPKPAGKGGFRLVTPTASKRESARGDIAIACREITDPAARLKDMDTLGIEIQVIYPTLFLVYITDDPKLELALCRAYNRWMAQVWSEGNNRLRWVAVLPLKSIQESISEARRAKDHGAVGIFFRGMEGDRTLDDPYFFPIYEEASNLDMPICIHTGAGSPGLTRLFNLERNGVFAHLSLPPLIAFRDLLSNEIPELFPRLRFGFIEASASWIPYLVHVLIRSSRPRPTLPNGRWKHASSVDLFRNYRLFVTCEADEDIGYLTKYVGEDNLLIGSDYGHNDPAEERHFVNTLKSRNDLRDETIEKIVAKNPRNFYSI